MSLPSATCDAFRHCHSSGQVNRKLGRSLRSQLMLSQPVSKGLNKQPQDDQFLLGARCVLLFSHLGSVTQGGRVPDHTLHALLDALSEPGAKLILDAFPPVSWKAAFISMLPQQKVVLSRGRGGQEPLLSAQRTCTIMLLNPHINPQLLLKQLWIINRELIPEMPALQDATQQMQTQLSSSLSCRLLL